MVVILTLECSGGGYCGYEAEVKTEYPMPSWQSCIKEMERRQVSGICIDAESADRIEIRIVEEA